MKYINALNTKLKVIILIVYTLIIGVVSFLIVNTSTKQPQLKGYEEQIKNNYVDVSFRMQESRKSAEQQHVSHSHEGEDHEHHEEATYNIYAYFQKKTIDENKEFTIKNIMFYVTGITKDGRKVFAEQKGSTTQTISYTGKSLSFSSSIAPSSIFSLNVEHEDGKEVIDNKIPEELYIRILFDVTERNKETSETVDKKEEIKYKTSLKIEKESKFENYKTIEYKEGTNKLALDKEPFDFDIVKRFVSGTSTTVDRGRYDFKVTLDSTKLGGKKLENVKVEVFGKVKNDESDHENEYPDYVLMYQYFGSVISSTGSNNTTDLAESYGLNDMYIRISVKYEGAKEEITTYKLSL